jgi:hypothetical protein
MSTTNEGAMQLVQGFFWTKNATQVVIFEEIFVV